MEKVTVGIKRAVIIIQLLALSALVLAGILMLMRHKGYDLYLFCRAISHVGVPCLFSVFFLCEIVFFSVLLATKKKLVLILPILLLIPLLLFSSFFWWLRDEMLYDSHVLSYEGIESELFIESESFFFGYSTLYEKDGILLKKLIFVEGDDGYCPLSQPNYQIEVDGSTVRIYGFTSIEPYSEICLHHKNGAFLLEKRSPKY